MGVVGLVVSVVGDGWLVGDQWVASRRLGVLGGVMGDVFGAGWCWGKLDQVGWCFFCRV